MGLERRGERHDSSQAGGDRGSRAWLHSGCVLEPEPLDLGGLDVGVRRRTPGLAWPAGQVLPFYHCTRSQEFAHCPEPGVGWVEGSPVGYCDSVGLGLQASRGGGNAGMNSRPGGQGQLWHPCLSQAASQPPPEIPKV